MPYLFKTDPVYPWAYWDNLFTEDECKEIIRIGNLLDQTDAGISNESVVDNNIRICKIAWIKFNKDTKFIYERISNATISLNERFFKFDLAGFVENFQFTEYKEPDNFYSYHVDNLLNNSMRKLSVTLQLTQEDQYEGGDLELFFEQEPIKMKKNIGKLIVFPSHTLHRVLPVTKGTRHSLVGWVNGPPFK
jgi:PKHD-type hydroxylase